MKGCAYYKLILEKGDVTQAFKVPMRLIQKTWTLFIEGTLAFRLLGNRENQHLSSVFTSISSPPSFANKFLSRETSGYETVTIAFNKDSFLANTFFSSV